MAEKCGIDLGTTYSAVSWYDADNNRVETLDLDSQDGERTMPSVVYFEQGGNVVVGKAAAQAKRQHPDRVVEAIKQSMGTDFSVTIDGQQYTPQQISAEILKVLKADAEMHLGEIEGAVITVPAHFGDAERAATKEAAELAGINVIELIAEPHAATLALTLDRMDDVADKPILAYDLGGGTFDVTLITAKKVSTGSGTNSLSIDTICKEGLPTLGGINFNQRLRDHVAERSRTELSFDPFDDLSNLALLEDSCEQGKRVLSRALSAMIVGGMGGQAQAVDVTREEFNQITEDLLSQTELLMDQVLEEGTSNHGVDADAVAYLLCGGSTKMPMVEEMFARRGVTPLLHKNRELLVTQGAAFRAHLSGGGIEDKKDGSIMTMPESPTDCGPAIGVEVLDNINGQHKKVNEVVVPDGTPFGTDSSPVTFRAAFDGQTVIDIVIYEGSSPEPAECRRLAVLKITDLPEGRPAGCPVEIKLGYDRDGMVRGQAVDLESSKVLDIVVDRSAKG